MRNKAHRVQALESLLKLPMFTIAGASKVGISRQTLARYVQKGTLERLYAGVYRSATREPQVDFEWEELAEVASNIPHGVICLISALCYYRLTDQMMRENWIAVPHEKRAPRRAHTRIIRMRNLKLGVTKVKMGEYQVLIFDRERCIVDAFKNLDEEIAIKALKSYLQGGSYKPDLRKLHMYFNLIVCRKITSEFDTLYSSIHHMNPRTRFPIQIDVGFGDAVKPIEKAITLIQTAKGPLFEKEVALLCYPPEFIFAEKLETLVYRGGANSRMKDFHDLYTMLQMNNFFSETIKTAIDLVFEHRQTHKAFPLKFSEKDVAALQVHWSTYRSRLPPHYINNLPSHILDCIAFLNERLNAIL